MIAMLDLTPIQSLGDIETFLTVADVFTLEPRCSRRELAQWIRSVLIQYLRDGITLADLQRQADKKFPNDAALEMQEAKRKLFQIILRGSSGTLPPSLIP